VPRRKIPLDGAIRFTSPSRDGFTEAEWQAFARAIDGRNPKPIADEVRSRVEDAVTGAMMFETRAEPKDSPSTIRKKLVSVRAGAARVQRVRRKPRSRDDLPAIEKALVRKLNDLPWPVLGEVADRIVIDVSPVSPAIKFTVDGLPEPAAVIEKALQAKNNHLKGRRPTSDARHRELIFLIARTFGLEIRASWFDGPDGPLLRLMREIYEGLARRGIMARMKAHAIDERIREAAGKRPPQRLARRPPRRTPPS
jgi:hypothetical protein